MSSRPTRPTKPTAVRLAIAESTADCRVSPKLPGRFSPILSSNSFCSSGLACSTNPRIDTASRISGNSARKLKNVIAPAYWLPLFSVYRPQARTTWASQGKRPWAPRHLSLARSLSWVSRPGLLISLPLHSPTPPLRASAHAPTKPRIAPRFRREPGTASALRAGDARSLTEDRAGGRDAGATHRRRSARTA